MTIRMERPASNTEQLIRRAGQGDREAFDRLAGIYRERLLALVRTWLGPSLRSKVAPEDVAQETFLRAFRWIARFERGDGEAFFRWLGGIARNVLHESSRRHGRNVLLALDDELPAVGVSQSKASERDERFERLQAALDSLSADHRTVILLARVDRLPLAEVARRMERSPEAVSQLLWRALRKLKESFGSTDSFHLPDRRLRDREDRDGSRG